MVAHRGMKVEGLAVEARMAAREVVMEVGTMAGGERVAVVTAEGRAEKAQVEVMAAATAQVVTEEVAREAEQLFHRSSCAVWDLSDPYRRRLQGCTAPSPR